MTKSKNDVQDMYWDTFLDWLEEVSFDPRNGEHIDTIFWWWWINVFNRGKGKTE